MTDAARTVTRFAVQPDGEERFVLIFEDDTGAVIRLRADEEQLDVLADLIDDALGTTEGD